MNIDPPQTWTGYDREGNDIVVCTAKDASEYVNVENVISAIEKAQAIIDEKMNAINVAIEKKIAPDAEEAIVVEGTKITPVLEEIMELVESYRQQIQNSLIGLDVEVLNARNKIQGDLNTDAYNQVATYPNVVNIQ